MDYPDVSQLASTAPSAAETAAGFVRRLRFTCRHEVCGQITVLAPADAEQLARDPASFSHLACSTCGTYQAASMFVWAEDATPVAPTTGHGRS